VTIGFFEGGPHPLHSAYRQTIREQLDRTPLQDVEINYHPDGFASASWNRDSSKTLARLLRGVESIDLMITFGPWVVEDLLEAGYSKPIIAIHRFDPILEGLADSAGRPVADNLTVHIKPGKLESDLRALTALIPTRRLGFLHFPSENEHDKVFQRMTELGRKMGFEVVTADQYDNKGTFAFFKSYQSLQKDIDALYLSPLWTFNGAKMTQFFEMVASDRIPSFCSGGPVDVGQGGLATFSRPQVTAITKYHVWKLGQILEGVVPADLPVAFSETEGLTINRETMHKVGLTVPELVLLEATLVGRTQLQEIEPLRINDAVGRAMFMNPGYLVNQEALQQAVVEASIAVAQYYPQVRGIGSVGIVDDNTVNNRFGEITNEWFSARLEVEQTLLSFSTIKSIGVANKRKGVAESDERDAALKLERAVSLACVNLAQTLEQERLAEEYRTRIDFFRQVAEADRFTSGSKSSDVRRWQTERLRATRQISETDKDGRTARVLLNVLLNNPGESPVLLDAGLFGTGTFQKEFALIYRYWESASQRTQVLDFFVNQALQSNRSLDTRHQEVVLRTLQLKANRASYYPSVGVRASLGYVDELVDSPPEFEERHTAWFLETFIELPVFLGGRRSRERDKLRAALGQSEYYRDHAQLEVMRKVRNQALELFSSMDQSPLVIDEVRTAEEQLKVIAAEYDRGTIGLAEALESLGTWREARLSSIASKFRFFGAVASLVCEVGWSAYENDQTASQELAQHLAEQFGNR
jgi:outer membrane protein TolC